MLTLTLMAKVRVTRVTDHGRFKAIELRGVPMDQASPLAGHVTDQGQVLTLRVSDPVLLDHLRQGAVFSLALTSTGEQTAPDPED